MARDPYDDHNPTNTWPVILTAITTRPIHGLGPSVGRGCDRRKDHDGIEDTESLYNRDVVRESWVKIKLLVVI